jgi:hypothetical protein
MITELLNGLLEKSKTLENNKVVVKIGSSEVLAYENSFHKDGSNLFFTGVIENEKFLFVTASNNSDEVLNKFEGSILETEEGIVIKKCPQVHGNVVAVQAIFDFTTPKLLGFENSFGFGDRIGLANPAHLRSLTAEDDFAPILAQQSIRELSRTVRKAENVMDAAVWAVMQEGWTAGFGSDADHLKTEADIDTMVNAGFTMFTFDPSDHVVNEADTMSIDELEKYVSELEWDSSSSTAEVLGKYAGKDISVNNAFTLSPSKEDALRALVKYGKSILHIKKLYSYLRETYPNAPVEIEVSVDETESVTTPFEHFFMANELTQLGVVFISLAPRFIGDFEKGIDYKGDLDIFKEEYLKHIAITEHFGNYKISLHSGSDKFSVYAVIGSLHSGYTHVKTAGTSYLEALRVAASADEKLFREIFDFAQANYEVEKKTYHVSADLNKVKKASEYSEEELADLLNQDDARQIFHVTFGLVLTIKDDSGEYIYRSRIYKCLEENEELHYKYLVKHFRRHLDPFNK